jgi:hypothetical protein
VAVVIVLLQPELRRQNQFPKPYDQWWSVITITFDGSGSVILRKHRGRGSGTSFKREAP